MPFNSLKGPYARFTNYPESSFMNFECSKRPYSHSPVSQHRAVRQFKQFCLFVFLAVAGVGDAWSHTFALGLRAGDKGGVEVWFRTWHGCNAPLSEGFILI